MAQCWRKSALDPTDSRAADRAIAPSAKAAPRDSRRPGSPGSCQQLAQRRENSGGGAPDVVATEIQVAQRDLDAAQRASRLLVVGCIEQCAQWQLETLGHLAAIEAQLKARPQQSDQR